MLPKHSAGYEENSAPVLKPNFAFIAIILGALIAFEIFNFSTTDHALRDLLGELSFTGVRWATILALAFCGIDFAGIARLFTPEQGIDEPKEVWYLFAAWLLAATMNAILTWWGVSIAVATHTVQSTAMIDPRTLLTVVPVFVAVMVWVVRILIIGTLSIAADRMLHHGQGAQQTALERAVQISNDRARAGETARQGSLGAPVQRPLMPTGPAPRAASGRRGESPASRVENNTPIERQAPGELSYHSLSARPNINRGSQGGSRESGAGPNRSIRS